MLHSRYFFVAQQLTQPWVIDHATARSYEITLHLFSAFQLGTPVVDSGPRPAPERREFVYTAQELRNAHGTAVIFSLVQAISPWLSDRRYFAILRRLAIRARKKTGAKFVGVTGSSAKSTTTGLLSHILAGKFRVHGHVEGNHLRPLLRSLAGLQHRNDFAIVETGIVRPGQMKEIAGLLRPDVVIATMIALEHKSAFGSTDAIAAEKSELFAALSPEGFAVVNADDPLVMSMAQRSRARIVTFGCSERAEYRAVDIQSGFPERLGLTVVWPGGTLPLQTKFVGDHFWLPTIAAVSTAIELGVPPDEIAASVASYEPLPGRCGVLSIPNGPHFILDTLKAPWHSVQLAIDVVARAPAPRKRIVLGHMSDYYGSNTKYRDFYRAARKVADQVIFVGDHSHRSKASPEDIQEDRFRAFTNIRQVAEYIRETAVPGEVILLKGSVGLHLERVALAWTHDVKCWVENCGKRFGCLRCGLYETPYEQHKHDKKGRRRRRRTATVHRDA